MPRFLARPFAPLVLCLSPALLSGCSETSRLRSACLGGDVARCIELGDMYAAGNRVPRDLTLAAEMYQLACDRGAADTCNALGEIYERGTEFEGGQQRAEQLFRLACGGGSPPGCLNLGLVLAAHDDKKTAATLFEKSCTAGWTPACHHLAQAFEQGAGVLVDLPRAVGLYEESCTAKFVESCLTLGALYVSGERVDRDAVRATRYYGTALKLLSDSCSAGHDADCKERDRLRTRMTLLGLPTS